MSPRRFAAVALAGSLLLAGCSDDPEPRFEEPTKSSSPSASESSSAAEEQTAEEFIREWFALSTAMQNTGDTSEFLDASSSCRPCNELAERVEKIYGDGGSIQLAKQTVVRLDPGSESASLKQFDVTVRASPTTVRESSDAEPMSLKGGRTKYQVTVVREHGHWLVENLVGLSL